MYEPQTFRSSFNGFHREDVVNHIAYMTAKHENQLKALREENEALRTEAEGLRARIGENAEQSARVPELEQAVAERDAELAEAYAELDAVNQQLAEQAKQIAELKNQLEDARVAAKSGTPIEESASHWDELRAYRRAELVERQARERVNGLYNSASYALRNAGNTLGQTNAAFGELAEKFRADLVELMEMIDTGTGALSGAADTLDGLRFEETE
ncbi:MAG: hypothetical protein IKD27_01315 [Oscillospiraceae bacterium]|nr:hypothetical protein [Oscillospiraceae bacterium]